MNKLNPVPEAIKKNIESLETVFVFPTQTAANAWADWTVRNTDAKSVPMERFIAWDDFKGEAVKSKKQEKRSIPGAMRTIFADNLIKKNADEKFLSYIVSKEYAESAGSFTKWISGILPSLAMWKNRFDSSRITPDDEDSDYLEIYTRYRDFLDRHSLFDPAWETPPFDSRGKRYVIFFPEIIMDYLEYQEILENTPDVEIIKVPELDSKPQGLFYSNSRSELRQLCLWLRKNHDEKNIKWQDMAVSAFDLETWWPYLDREMDIYEIPHVLKNGTPLTSSTAGNLFRQIQSCVSENFSFESIKKLILNTSLPWADFSLNQRLIHFGQENNCLCSFQNQESGKEYDVWKNAFSSPLKNEQPDQKMVEMYSALKNILTSMVKAKTFDEIRTHYFNFRTHFFNVENFTEKTDRIISRCISELSALIDLEKDFPDCQVSNCYSFFLNYISDKNYVPQVEEQGVQILPYRLSAPAPFRIQAVIDSSQASLSVIYRELAFLNDEKRARLGLKEEVNVSDLFIKLYALNSTDETVFTAAEKTFTGYALTSSYLEEKNLKDENDFENLNESDMYISEKESLLNAKTGFPKKITSIESKGFESWKTMQSSDENEVPDEQAVKKINSLIDEKLFENGKVKITYSHMKSFYEDCHQFMKHYVLKLEEENSAADLTPPFLIGNLNHKILEIYCTTLMENDLPLHVNEDDGCLDEKYGAILKESIKKGIQETESSCLTKILIDSSIAKVESKMISVVTDFSNSFNGYMIHAVEKKYTHHPEGKDYFFDGKVDCILKDPLTGDCILIDFKSTKKGIPSANFFAGDDVTVPDFQMPIYIHLLENQEPPIRIENCAFYNINDEKTVPVIGPLVKAKAGNTLELSMKRFLSQADFYARRIIAHDIDSEPAAESWIRFQMQMKKIGE